MIVRLSPPHKSEFRRTNNHNRDFNSVTDPSSDGYQRSVYRKFEDESENSCDSLSFIPASEEVGLNEGLKYSSESRRVLELQYAWMIIFAPTGKRNGKEWIKWREWCSGIEMLESSLYNHLACQRWCAFTTKYFSCQNQMSVRCNCYRSAILECCDENSIKTTRGSLPFILSTFLLNGGVKMWATVPPSFSPLFTLLDRSLELCLWATLVIWMTFYNKLCHTIPSLFLLYWWSIKAHENIQEVLLTVGFLSVYFALENAVSVEDPLGICGCLENLLCNQGW